MKFSKKFIRPGVAGLALTLGLLAAGCQQSGGFTADQRDPIGPAPSGIASPGIGAPGGQSVDTRGTGTVSSSEGDASLTGPADAIASRPGIR